MHDMAMTDALLIYGCGGVGAFVLQVVRELNDVEPTWQVRGFLDDALELAGTTFHSHPVIGGVDLLRSIESGWAVVAVGAPSVKAKLSALMEAAGFEWATLVHPDVWLAAGVEVGGGSILYPGVKANVGCSIGAHCTVNMNVALGHDVRLEDFATVSPGAALGGYTRVGEGAFIGIGASLIQGVTIGAWSVVGAGAVVIEDVEPNTVVAGVPARVIKRREPGWQND